MRNADAKVVDWRSEKKGKRYMKKECLWMGRILMTRNEMEGVVECCCQSDERMK